MPQNKPNRILLVEDEPDIRKIVQVSLQEIGGFTMQTCGSGHEALEIVKAQRPDLIILDVMMPVMDGLDTLREIHKIDDMQDIPVIFLTAKVQPHEVEKYLELGVIGVISKPFDPIRLPQQINDLWCKLEMV